MTDLHIRPSSLIGGTHEWFHNDNPAPWFTTTYVGNYSLVLIVGLTVCANFPAPVWSITAALTSMISTLGNCSRVHSHLAVKLAFLLGGRNRCGTRRPRHARLSPRWTIMILLWLFRLTPDARRNQPVCPPRVGSPGCASSTLRLSS